MARNTTVGNSTEASARPTRVPIGKRNRLAIKNKEPGYVYRIVNDVDDGIEQFIEGGYEIATKERVGATGDKRVDDPSSLGSIQTISVGKGLKAVVMRQKEADYKADQAAKQAEIDELEQTMKADARRNADYGSLEIHTR